MDKTHTCKTELEAIRDQHSHNLYEICEAVIEYFDQDTSNAQEAFRCFLTQIEIPLYDTGEIPQDFLSISEEKVDRQTCKRLREMEKALVQELIFQDAEENYFYDELWRRLSDTLLVSSSAQKAAFLNWLWLDPCIPYYQLGLGITMDEEMYSDIVEQLYPQRRKLVFVLNVGYPQRTQKVSILMKLADELSDDKQRIVFWSLVLGRLENQVQRLRTQKKRERSDG